MAPQRQKRTKRKLPTRNIVDADFVSSSASARIVDDFLLHSNHDRAILSDLWDNQETARSELPHVVVASTQRRLVQPSTDTVEKTYLQRLQEQRKDTTDLSAQSIIPVALLNNMNAKITTAITDSDSEGEAYTTLSPINQQVGMGTDHPFSYVSPDPSSQDGVSADKADQSLLSLNVLQVSGIDCLHKKDTPNRSLHNENDLSNDLLLEESHVIELIQHEPDHSNIPMAGQHESAVNDQAPVSSGQAVMMEAEIVNEDDMMETEVVNDMLDNVNEKGNGGDSVNEKDNCVNNVDTREGLKAYEEVLPEVDEANDEEADEEDVRADEEVLAEADEGVRVDEEAGEANEEEAGEVGAVEEVVEEAAGEKEVVEEEAIEEEAIEGEAAEEEAAEEEAAEEAAGEKEVVEEEAAEEKEAEEEAAEEQVCTEKDPVGPIAEPNCPSFDVDEEITLRIRSVEPVPCLFLTALKDPRKDDDLVSIKQEPLDESEFPSFTEEFMNTATSGSSDECTNNAAPCYTDECTNNVLSGLSDGLISSVSYHTDDIMNSVISGLPQEFINSAESYHCDQITDLSISYNSDQITNAPVSDYTDAIASNAVSGHYDESISNVLPCTSDEFMNNVVTCNSDSYISEEETLSLQVQSEEPSSCLYRMSASIEREDGLVPIKQEPIDEIPVDMATLVDLINPYRYDTAAALDMDLPVTIKQEPIETEFNADNEFGPMEIEYQSPDLQGNPEISDMQEIEYSEVMDEAEIEQEGTVNGMSTVEVERNHTDTSSVKPKEWSGESALTETVAGQQETAQGIDSPFSTSSSDNGDWLTLDDLDDDGEQDLVYNGIFNVMSIAKPLESKPIMTKPSQNKGQKRFRPGAWNEDSTDGVVLTNKEKERVCKRRRILRAKLHKPYIVKKKMKCVWFVEADSA